jgi:ribosomal protein S18 acetylase RimI-like enzyme
VRHVNTASPTEIDRCTATLTLAFCNDPPSRWAWPDSQQYLESFPGFVHALAGKAFGNSSAYRVGDFSGVALWLPPGVEPDEQATVSLIERTTTAEVKEAMFSIVEQMATNHPPEPHWYLPLIGVDPACQSCGLGSVLLSHVLAECDRQAKLAYLEASSPRNVLLYVRHGFEEVGKIQSGSSPVIVPMVRKPK